MVEHFSASGIKTYQACPLRFRFQYIDDLPEKGGNPYFVRGRAVHKGIETYYRDRMAGVVSPDVEKAVGACLALFDVEQEEIDDLPRRKIRGFREQAEGMTRIYIRDLAWKINPTGVEIEAEDILPCGHKYVGFVDLVTDRGFIRDTKTASWMPSESAADESLQLVGYAHLLRMIPCRASLDFIVWSERKVVTRWTSVTKSRVRGFLETVADVANRVERGEFAANPSKEACRWCDFSESCPSRL